MSNKPGRNEPCPCGSGKKYKNCCAKAEAQSLQEAKAHEEAVPRAIGWLAQYHRKAFAEALQQEIHETALAASTTTRTRRATPWPASTTICGSNSSST